MAESRGFSSGFNKTEGDRGRGRDSRRGRGRGRGPATEIKEWVPVSKLGRLVLEGKITSLEEIYVNSLPIKEYQIVDFLYEGKGSEDGKSALKDDVMKIMPVQKQTRAGQRTRFKAFVAVGDCKGHVGLGVKCAKEVATAIRGAIIAAKLSLIPVRRGYWGSNIGAPHTVAMKISGKCGSVRVRLVPAPRGSQVVGAPTTKKMLYFAGLQDCFTSTTGRSRTKGNFMKALFDALTKTYSFLTPDLWRETKFPISPYQQHSAILNVPYNDAVISKPVA